MDRLEPVHMPGVETNACSFGWLEVDLCAELEDARIKRVVEVSSGRVVLAAYRTRDNPSVDAAVLRVIKGVERLCPELESGRLSELEVLVE